MHDLKAMKLVLAVVALCIGLCAGVSLRENTPARDGELKLSSALCVYHSYKL